MVSTLAGEDWLTGRRVLSIESSEIEGRLQSFKGGAFLPSPNGLPMVGVMH